VELIGLVEEIPGWALNSKARTWLIQRGCWLHHCSLLHGQAGDRAWPMYGGSSTRSCICCGRVVS